MGTAEVLVCITGMDFSFSQAPESMKAVLTSFWLLTVGIGNLIDIIVTGARLIDGQSLEFFVFAGMMFVANLFFIIIALRYKYVDESKLVESHNKDSVSLLNNGESSS